MNTADDVRNELIRIYGEEPAAPVGVLHVTALWQSPAGGLHVLRINDRTPASSTDAFVLGVARARADAVITTGACLRGEPRLHHGLDGLRRPGRALRAWRRERIGKKTAPISCVLTASGNVDTSHPLFRKSAEIVVYTRPDVAEDLMRDLRKRGIDRACVVADADSSLESAVRYLREARDCKTVSIEAGASAASTLYEPGNDSAPVVEELMLSRYEAGTLDDAVLGPVLCRAERLEELFSRNSAPFEAEEESGPWSFRRLAR